MYPLPSLVATSKICIPVFPRKDRHSLHTLRFVFTSFIPNAITHSMREGHKKVPTSGKDSVENPDTENCDYSLDFYLEGKSD